MCIIYLFAGTAKLTGPAWWDGTALWMALGNMEYQSLDMTWLADWPQMMNLMTHVTVFWEIFVLRAGLAARHAARRVAVGDPAAHGHRHLPGNGHLRSGHVDRQHGIYSTGIRAIVVALE